jgi:hypothetical protein
MAMIINDGDGRKIQHNNSLPGQYVLYVSAYLLNSSMAQNVETIFGNVAGHIYHALRLLRDKSLDYEWAKYLA